MFPPVELKKMTPDWYKNLSLNMPGIDSMDAKNMVQGEHQTSFTIKGCIPVLDYVTSGYVLVAHSDILITPEVLEGMPKNFWWKSNGAKVGAHNFSQCPVKINNTENTYFKITNPWSIETPSGYSCLFYQPEYHMETRFKLFPAIVDTDKYTQEVHFPGVVLAEKSFIIEAGTPLMVVFPFKRDSWVKTVSLEEKPKANPLSYFLSRAYKRLCHVKKEYN
jgi:hypothetical protein